VKASHHAPTRNSTIRNGSVDETEVFDMMNRSKILKIWTKTAAIYPTPTPLEDILVDKCKSEDSRLVRFEWFSMLCRVMYSDDSLRLKPGDKGSNGIEEVPATSYWSIVLLSGWLATRTGRNELRRTKLDPRHVTPIITRKDATRKIRGTTAMKLIEEIDPITPNPIKNFLR
jgi:hypothetical protein